jgi:hypothetical protein
VPDFGQTKFDNTILNLLPFNGNFTKTDLSSRKRQFIQQRVDYFEEVVVLKHRQLNLNEEITDYPSTVDL